MTRNLLQALQPSKGKQGDASNINDDFENFLGEEDYDNAQDNLIDLEYPTSFWHLVKILRNTNEKKVLALSNPDGYFYLFFIKTAIKFFCAALLLAGSAMWYTNHYSRRSQDEEAEDADEISFLTSISLPYNLFQPGVYHSALVLTGMLSALAYYFLFIFCNEMTQFEFQPDQ